MNIRLYVHLLYFFLSSSDRNEAVKYEPTRHLNPFVVLEMKVYKRTPRFICETLITKLLIIESGKNQSPMFTTNDLSELFEYIGTPN